MHARGRGHRARVLRCDEGGLVAQIDHDDFVADAVHLGKWLVGERAHGIFRWVTVLYMANDGGLASAANLCRAPRTGSGRPMKYLSWDESRPCVLEPGLAVKKKG